MSRSGESTSGVMTDSVSNPPELPRLYPDLADWWPLLSAPEEYAEEAEFYRQTILSSCELAPHTLLELGSGGGNNASHLKRHFQMTLVDLSPGMLEVSQRLNPDSDDTTYATEMVYLLRDGTDQVQVVQDRHVCGLFAHEV